MLRPSRTTARRLSVAGLFAGAALSVGSCHAKTGEPPPLPLLGGVEVVGCASIVAGPICRVGRSRTLRVVVDQGASDVTIGSDVGPPSLDAGAAASQGMVRIVVPSGASQLSVEAVRGGRRRRFSIPIGDAQPEVTWLREAREDATRGALDDAERVLDVHAPHGPDGSDDADVASLRARLVLARGDVDRAIDLLGQSAAMHAAKGELSAAVDDESARAELAIRDTFRFAEARAALAHLRALSRDDAEASGLAMYVAGSLAWATDDMHQALTSFDEARAEAERLGYGRLARESAGWQAIALSEIGRLEEASAAATRLEQTQWQAMTVCERANLRVNQGWFTLLAREAPSPPSEPLPDPKPALREAEATFGGDCADPQKRANAQVNLAWAHLQDGDIAGARETLEGARALVPSLEPFVALFALDLEGRIALAAGDPHTALAAYAELAARSAGVSRLDEARAAEGESDARARMGDRAGALAAIEHADATLDEAARSVRLGEGRGAFWWTRARVAERSVGLLLDAGRSTEALDVVRRTRARIAEDVRRTTGVKPLDDHARERWEEALASYRRGRDALAKSAEADWSLPRDALARAVLSRRTADDELRGRLDAVGAQVFPAMPRALAPLAVEDGTLALAWYPLEGSWAAFRVAGGLVRAERVVAPTDGAHVRDAASTLLASAADAIAHARRLRVFAFDALRDVDVHALPFPPHASWSEPLLARLPVEYGLDAEESEAVQASGPPLVVADPTDTLPAARREGEATAAALDAGARTLVGAEATRARVLAELPAASALYYSGHAAYAGVDGWESALVVAGGQRISVGDLLALPRAPRLVVLAGCETGREGERGGAAGLGIAEAFVAAGSRTVIASPRVVRDVDAETFSRVFVAALAEMPDDPSGALRRAELDWRRADPLRRLERLPRAHAHAMSAG